MPAVSFSRREFVDKIQEMDIFTTFRVHTRDPPRLKVGDIVTCFYKQRAKKECGNCIGYHPHYPLKDKKKERGWCIDKNGRKFRRHPIDICDDFNKIICKAEVKVVESAEIGKDYLKLFVPLPKNNIWEILYELGDPPLVKIAKLDKFDSAEEFLKFFDEHHKLPMLFDRYTFKKIKNA